MKTRQKGDILESWNLENLAWKGPANLSTTHLLMEINTSLSYYGKWEKVDGVKLGFKTSGPRRDSKVRYLWCQSTELLFPQTRTEPRTKIQTCWRQGKQNIRLCGMGGRCEHRKGGNGKDPKLWEQRMSGVGRVGQGGGFRHLAVSVLWLAEDTPA